MLAAPFAHVLLQLRCPPRACESVSDAGCKYGTKAYWDGMYSGRGEACTKDGLSAEQYSWYCGWTELEPFWTELVPDLTARVLVPGVGNDDTVAGLFDAGWSRVSCFDYSPDAISRAAELYGDRAIELRCADARALPYSDASFDAVLDKGALDAVGIAGREALAEAIVELSRTVAAGGVVVSVSRALETSTLVEAFDPASWEVLRDGGLHLAESGEASTDLAANLLAWRRNS